jgi:SpoVK/Ycf46/Vps4 family AAA+-type ATPase
MAGRLEGDSREAVAQLESALFELIRPSTQRGITVERPRVSFSRLIVTDFVGAALEQLVVLAEMSPELAGTERRGVKAMFAGPSGTGKTLAARALASHLDLPLYRIDLASVVSKWVGETEKNLSRAFEAAEIAGAVLLFDEGDALLAKRGEISRGTDRYANLEVSYLLQAVEAHDGVVIVTTNQKQNIDTAFQRRFDLIVEFTPPSAEARVLLWRQELGSSGAALAPDFMQALGAADLSGGNIAGAARLARAISQGRGEGAVTAEDVRHAVAAEFRKLGSTVQASNWAGLVKRNA